MKDFRFYKNDSEWFVDLPEYIAQGGSVSDLQMVEGADEMLDIISRDEKSVTVTMAVAKFDGADLLILKERCEPVKGGGYYFLHHFEGKDINLTIWLCKVTAFVFGEIPVNIFIKRKNRGNII